MQHLDSFSVSFTVVSLRNSIFLFNSLSEVLCTSIQQHLPLPKLSKIKLLLNCRPSTQKCAETNFNFLSVLLVMGAAFIKVETHKKYLSG